MPELPEVETTCQGIKPIIVGKKIKTLIIRQGKLRWPISHELSTLQNETIIQVNRRAKYLILKLSKGSIIIHLGMSGRLRLTQEITSSKHDHVDFVLDNGVILRYTDPRKFGSIHFTTTDINQHFLIKLLGVEPLSVLFNEQYLFNIAQNKKINIKQLIMDQRVVVGIGNIYAQEALFTAAILPYRAANTLSRKECKALVQASQTILKLAIKKGGTTLKDFLSPDGKPGYFIQKLFVYGRSGKSCYHCHNPLQTLRISNRSTIYCPHCQK